MDTGPFNDLHTASFAPNIKYICMPDDSMEPQFDIDDPVILVENRGPEIGDTIVFSLKADPTTPIVRRYAGASEESIIVNTHAPDSGEIVKRDDLAYVCRVVCLGAAL